MCWDSAHFTESWLLYEIRNRRTSQRRKVYSFQLLIECKDIQSFVFMLPDTGEPDIENIVWANKRERNLSLLIIQYGPNLPLFLFGAYSEAAICHIECYSQIDHAVVFAPVFLVV